MKLKILTEIILLSKVMYQMMNAGYLEMKNVDRIDDWIILFQEPILDIFIRYHKIGSSAKDIPTSDEYVINPQYRKMICVTLMKILANFIVSNGYASIDDVSKFENIYILIFLYSSHIHTHHPSSSPRALVNSRAPC